MSYHSAMKIYTTLEASSLAAASIRTEGIRAYARRIGVAPGSVLNAVKKLERGGIHMTLWQWKNLVRPTGFALVSVQDG